ncbi:hypothetical protein HGRIS_014962 [Hohenbuehelia grisea]|uniref:Uncharacterized protein n=1 Tax=Hohenbuehelia grisea TaxID=104357 RepID=A0ABR3JWG3_9AGAR
MPLSQMRVLWNRKLMYSIFPADNDDEDPNEGLRDPNLHTDDPFNFFKLSRALRLLLAREITVEEADEADLLLREYCIELIELYGPEVMCQNHHYCTHIRECIRDFGPLHGFWTFLFERINKVLKSYKTSNHAGDELETSFFRKFHRTIQHSRVMARSFTGTNMFVDETIIAMHCATADARGTVQGLARELDEANVDGGVAFHLAPRFQEASMSPFLYGKMLRHLRENIGIRLRSHIALGPEPPLLHNAIIRRSPEFAGRRLSHLWLSKYMFSCCTGV